jgi:hypothetical protein
MTPMLSQFRAPLRVLLALSVYACQQAQSAAPVEDESSPQAEFAPSLERIAIQEGATPTRVPTPKQAPKFDLEVAPAEVEVLPELEIKQWRFPYTDQRRRLTVQYLRAHRGGEFTGNLIEDTTMVPQLVVIHWTGGPTAKSARNTFYAARQSGRDDPNDHNALNLSAHFVVAQDGTVYQLMDETTIGRHVIGLNHLSIGIENVGDRHNLPLTDAQLEANTALIHHLNSRHPITHVIGHYEYQEMEGHPYFQERRASFRTVRGDPGKEFMARLRESIKGLGLQGTPVFTAD